MDKSDRERLPDERKGLTHKFKIKSQDEDHRGYLTVGFYEDGRVGEIFVKMDSQGSQVSGFVDAWAIAVSMLLQTGTPLETICNKFRGHAFPPDGLTTNPKIRVARSPIDYIARWLEMKFVDPGLDDADQS
jgi:ribonucleoside-diphosphate reductase alpha chain